MPFTDMGQSHLYRYGFIFIIILLVLIASFIYNQPTYAMWFGFFIAGYSAIANDSIQTLGTFLASNRSLHWVIIWLFVGGILVICLMLGWYSYNGSIAFGRLQAIPQPLNFTLLEMLAPIVLLILTYFKMPVSTTFLLLSIFSQRYVVKQMLLKTLLGYSLAILLGTLIFIILGFLVKKLITAENYNKNLWRTLQFLSTALLWSAWIMHDSANIAVFLPRQLNIYELVTIICYFLIVIAILMFLRGGRIQTIVTSKTDINNYRSATIIDFLYAILLIFFFQISHFPMSTTWVFLGLLAGREIAYRTMHISQLKQIQLIKNIGLDFFRAGIGLLISLFIAWLT